MDSEKNLVKYPEVVFFLVYLCSVQNLCIWSDVSMIGFHVDGGLFLFLRGKIEEVLGHFETLFNQILEQINIKSEIR